jgi:hypothetical protein
MAGGEYIAAHTITYEYIITDDPLHGLLLLISPWSGENSRGLYFSLLFSNLFRIFKSLNTYSLYCARNLFT